MEVSEHIKRHLRYLGKAVLVMLDLLVAFDTVPHLRLLSRLQSIGVSGIALKWLSFFLEERSQEIWIPMFSSEVHEVSVGVPQGSVLSSALFNACLTPLGWLAEELGAKVISYADNIQLLFTCGKGEEIAGETFKECLSSVFHWMTINHLKCNAEKTEILFFSSISPVLW